MTLPPAGRSRRGASKLAGRRAWASQRSWGCVHHVVAHSQGGRLSDRCDRPSGALVPMSLSRATDFPAADDEVVPVANTCCDDVNQDLT